MVDSCDLSAREARRLIGMKKLSPVELLASCHRRIESVNGAVNGFVTLCPERARAEAEEAERMVMEGETLPPLHGLPLGVKDLEETEGIRTTFGSPIYSEYIPSQDMAVVARLRQAGAIIIGKTNTPPFGAGANTTNPVFGPTRNPFDTRLTCGGSSGGSGVALACSMAPLCTGSDTGGSLRIPASYNGVAAHRATPGLVADRGRMFGYSSFAVLGPMGRDIADVALMLSAMAAFEPGDLLSRPVDPGRFHPPVDVDLSTLRVACSEDLGFAHVSRMIRETFRARTARFRGVFASASDSGPDLLRVRECKRVLRNSWFLESQKDHYRNNRDMIGANAVANYEDALTMKMTDLVWAQAEQTRIAGSLTSFFKDFDLLICPCVAVTPFPVEQLYPEEIDGEKLETYYEWFALTWGLTIPGNPVATIACGVDANGMPFGLQICAPSGADGLVLGAAMALEALFAGDSELARPVPDLAALAVLAA